MIVVTQVIAGTTAMLCATAFGYYANSEGQGVFGAAVGVIGCAAILFLPFMWH